MRRNLLLAIAIVALSIVLSGCVSEEAKIVIQQIDSLGEITLASYDELQQANQSYSQLSEEDRRAVRNSDKLDTANKKYNELSYIDLNERILLACSNITVTSSDELVALLEEYKNLSDDGKAHITNYQMLSSGIDKCNDLIAEKMVTLILDNANGSLSLAKSYLNSNADIMTEDQKQECLIAIGRWDSLQAAQNLLKKSLKNPNSLIVYSGKTTEPVLQDDSTYKVEWFLDYGASNSFGAMVRDDVEINVYFRIDVDAVSLIYTNAEYTPYYRWVMASR